MHFKCFLSYESLPFDNLSSYDISVSFEASKCVRICANSISTVSAHKTDNNTFKWVAVEGKKTQGEEAGT